MPWDEEIRRRLGFSDTGDGYRQQVERVRSELAEALADSGRARPQQSSRPPSAAPAPSAADLIDEHDWVRFTRGSEPPAPEVVRRWANRVKLGATKFLGSTGTPQH